MIIPTADAYDPQTDHDYDARSSVASFDAEYGKLVGLSDAARAGLPFTSSVYDAESGCALGLYGVAPGRQVFLWIHGGYWRLGNKEHNAFAAPGLVAAGVAVAVMDYSLAPDATLYTIVDQVRRAVAWLHHEGAALGLDVSQIHVGGSSVGGHLTGMMLADGWTDQYGLPENIIGAALAMSGIFDLEPLRATKVNGWMSFDDDAIAQLSPTRHIPVQTQARLCLTVGGLERQGFIRETDAYLHAWRAAGHSATEIAMPDHSHFDISCALSDPESAVTIATLAAIRDTARHAF